MIYLLDSDDAAATGLKRFLAAEGFNVAIVADAMVFAQNSPAVEGDLVLLDPATSGVDAKTLLSGLQAKGLQMPVIVISSSHEMSGGQRPVDLARGAGAVGFFSKPIDGHALVDAIRFAGS